MNALSKQKTGLTLGALIGLSHLMWGVLVATGVAQPFMNWIFQLHFIEPPYTITPFHLSKALLLVAITFLSGYFLGWFFAGIWNQLHSIKEKE